MKHIGFEYVTLNSGYAFEKQELNRTVTLDAVYRRFEETGRIKAFDFDYRDGIGERPHIFWDSDVAKWMEGAAYSLKKHYDKITEERLDSLIEKICMHQCSDGYFNIYFTAVEPAKRFSDRDCHELYCAGHLIEAAVACAKIGKPVLLERMEKYADCIEKAFVTEKSAKFASPGHEEIEIALLKAYRYTHKEKYFNLAKHFIKIRGTENDIGNVSYNQSHKPVQEQTEAVGHAVRALYLYTSMAMLALDSNDAELFSACKKLFFDITEKKMYVTGATGSTYIGEAFTNPYDLPNDTSYAETCASIGLAFFSSAMLENEINGKYGDVIERTFYNGILSGLSLDGKKFFYENALEIDFNSHFKNEFGEKRYPITRRPEIFSCSCCPPNLNRFLSSLGGYLFSVDGDTLYINQYAGAELNFENIFCTVSTDYPRSGEISICAKGVKKLAFRVPSWCRSFSCSCPYECENGYAYTENTGSPIEIRFDMSPYAVFSSPKVACDAYKLCIMRGPVLYCAEEDGNEKELHRYSLSPDFTAVKSSTFNCSLPEMDVDAYRLTDIGELYSLNIPKVEKAKLHLIPYNSFANRREGNMRVWFNARI